MLIQGMIFDRMGLIKSSFLGQRKIWHCSCYLFTGKELLTPVGLLGHFCAGVIRFVAPKHVRDGAELEARIKSSQFVGKDTAGQKVSCPGRWPTSGGTELERNSETGNLTMPSPGSFLTSTVHTLVLET